MKIPIDIVWPFWALQFEANGFDLSLSVYPKVEFQA